MTNDAKLGMLVGVLGVIGAAAFLAPVTPRPSAPEPSRAAQTAIAEPVAVKPSQPAALTSAPPSPAPSDPQARGAAEPTSTPVVRTRKELSAQPASRPSLADEEP